MKFPHLDAGPALYEGGLIHVRGLRRPTGQLWEVVTHPGAVAIVPVMDNGDIILIRNQRPVIDDELWEIPAGLLEDDELPLHTARRELLEEAGYEAKTIKPLLEVYSSPGFSSEHVTIFVATGLTLVGQQLDPDEHITVHRKSEEEVRGLLEYGKIHDCKTVAALYHYLMHGA